MLQAMLAGVTSIKAQQTRMNVIGNNLANVNTTAYKGSRVGFQDMLSQTLSGAAAPTDGRGGSNPVQLGLGVMVASSDTNTEQGSLNATNRPTDFAIQGSGFLMVSNGSRIGYTRDGAFALDSNGDLVHQATGERLMGWTADPLTGEIDTAAPVTATSRINIPLGLRAAVSQTGNVEFNGNLDARSLNATNTTSMVRVYDSLGSEHTLTVTYTKTTDNEWSWTVAGQPGDATVAGGGTLTFDPSTGTLLNGSPGVITVSPTNGAPPYDINLNFGEVSQVASETLVQAGTQDGFAPGTLSSFSVGPDGVVMGLYSNGLTRALAQIPLASFTNVGGLERVGSNLWRETSNSGIASVGAAMTSGRGTINSGFLEQSNVDISNEFTDLIITQRGFQANTRVVTTVDEMLQELINMKR